MRENFRAIHNLAAHSSLYEAPEAAEVVAPRPVVVMVGQNGRGMASAGEAGVAPRSAEDEEEVVVALHLAVVLEAAGVNERMREVRQAQT